ncbi:MAG: XdhC family protein [Acidimicrobiia bacterium]|nr:XdhC family protein [Actinomycetota bacterium]MBL6925130.1 XdhC family protein [Acidimicrobiia bacterium]
MFSLALSISACIRAGTRVDLAWIVDHHNSTGPDPGQAIAITPGGGRIGSLGSEALEGQLIELAGIQSRCGRLLSLDADPPDYVESGLGLTDDAKCVLVPGSQMPDGLWQLLLNREPVCLVSHLEGDTITDTVLYTADTISELGDAARELFERESSTAEIVGDTVVTALWPISTLVVVGDEEAAQPLCSIATALGWKTVVTGNANDTSGIIASLSPMDSVVVLGHDLTRSGGALAAALTGEVGYIGAVGSQRLQQSQTDWLAFRGFTDLSRIHGPAGLDIGARNPREVAVAVIAEIVATQTAEAE